MSTSLHAAALDSGCSIAVLVLLERVLADAAGPIPHVPPVFLPYTMVHNPAAVTGTSACERF